MKTILLAAGAVALALSAGAADAKGGHKKSKGGAASSHASPPQPIPYAMLDDYLKASPSQRASRDWWSGSAMAQAPTGAAPPASTTAPATTSPEAAPPVNPTTPPPSPQ